MCWCAIKKLLTHSLTHLLAKHAKSYRLTSKDWIPLAFEHLCYDTTNAWDFAILQFHCGSIKFSFRWLCIAMFTSVNISTSLKDTYCDASVNFRIMLTPCFVTNVKTVVLCWISSHFNIRSSERADAADKEMLSLCWLHMKFPASELISRMFRWLVGYMGMLWGYKIHVIYHNIGTATQASTPPDMTRYFWINCELVTVA